MRLLALLMLLSSPARADHDAFVHLTAHVGASYTLQTVFYGINNKIQKFGRVDSEALALLSTMAIGYAYKMSEHAPSKDVRRAMGQNLLGSALAIGTHIVFKF